MPKVGGSQISSANANPQVCGLLFFYSADRLQMWQFGDLRFAGHTFLAICRFEICGPYYSSRTKNFRKSANTSFFFLQNKSLKSSHTNSRTTSGFGTFCDIALRTLKYTYVGEKKVLEANQ
jgi:hypothetical protein